MDDDVYQYFLLDEDGLWSVSEQVDEYDCSDDSDEEIVPLPLDVNTVSYSGYGEEEDWTVDGDTTWYGDTEYGMDTWYYMSEAYGTLQTADDGSV